VYETQVGESEGPRNVFVGNKKIGTSLAIAYAQTGSCSKRKMQINAKNYPKEIFKGTAPKKGKLT